VSGLPHGLAVFSGPSGSGKTSICNALLADPRVSLSVSATTRSPRPDEKEGVHYHFYPEEKFLALRDAGAFVEWAEVYGFYYGTPLGPLEEASRQRERLLLLDIDVQGARQLRERGVAATFVFIAPPSLDVLRARLAARGTDQPEVIERRLRSARFEMDQRSLYDHVLINEDLDETIRAAKAVVGL